MTVKVFRHTDQSAPILNGQIGSLINVLDFCLPAAGWTKAFTGTNEAAYKQGVGSNQMYYYVNDNINNFARINGFETMSSLTTGTNKFPTSVCFGTSSDNDFLMIPKSDSTDNSPRAWIVIATEKIFYLIISHSYSQSIKQNSLLFCFGDLISTKNNDPYCTIITGNTTTSFYSFSIGTVYNSLTSYTNNEHYWLARPSTFFKIPCPINVITDSNLHMVSTLPTLDSINNNLYGLRLSVIESVGTNSIVRGYFPGLYIAPLNNYYSSINDGDIINNINNSDFNGKTLELRSINSSVTIMFEISNTW